MTKKRKSSVAPSKGGAICHHCKGSMDYYNYVSVPVVGHPGTCWAVCSRGCAVALAKETGIEIGEQT